ncbi:phosphatidylserine/phosphatidylglycerophosphate/cardiolipin synthase family protein [Denitrificimonas sp. JX-1]|uniref:Phosphatidylserine/phosphatidylglycerophosphate/ cardiolipin synthase family protein n=1 Tax=Denitrificimonas halotolerans TaxID=3098930 RepID=A0ABU5GQC4_9GAMM|nr:phosphatidylserine/phosphatidylglycerophosphate/cardiolipin synthase family protein [Denitrificimonas sp. JX-1]MDY7219201.1 phosphatidylserine/phosphatidylglycerophosphate/cardiolipin synthase family protein [Denitrificimonas sp. JX-1]
MAGLIFPWRASNQFELLIDGPAFFEDWLARIAQAQRQIDIELYLVRSGRSADRVEEALFAAVQRGVRVRCLFDGFGSRQFRHLQRRRWQASGIDLRFYNPMRWVHGIQNFYRDHRKLLIVDQSIAYVGGAGLTDDFWQPGVATSRWHEVMVRVEGPVVNDWQSLFDKQWDSCIERFFWKKNNAPKGAKNHSSPPLPLANTGKGRVAYAASTQHRNIQKSLLRAIAGAHQTIWLATPYFLPTWSVRRALRKAAARGVDVRLLLTGRHTDLPPVRWAGQRYYPALLRKGVRIFEYQPRFLHLKMVMVDDWVTVGSCNFDHWNLRFNLENNLEVRDTHFLQQVCQSFQHDFTQSLEITEDVWRQRPLLQRFRQRLWGWMDRLTINFLDKRK